MTTPAPDRRPASRWSPGNVALGLVLVLLAGVLATRSLAGADPEPAPGRAAGATRSAAPEALVDGPAAPSSSAVPSASAAAPRGTPGAPAPVASAAPVPAPPPPAPVGNRPDPGVVLFATGRAAPQERGPQPGLVVQTVRADGSERQGRPSAAAYPLRQVSGDLVATTEVLSGASPSAPPEQGIALVDLRTGAKRVVTRDGFDDAPVWSPDGRALAYRSRVEDPDGTQRGAVRLLSREGKDAGTVLLPPKGQSDGPPVWSPDGTRLATVRSRLTATGPASRVVLLGLEAKAPVVLADGEYSDLAWSPDGRTLAAVRSESGTRSDLWVLDVPRKAAKRVTSFAPPGNGVGRTTFCGQSGRVVPRVAEPVWSLDGRRLAYLSSYPHTREFARQADVEVVDVAKGTFRTAFATPKAACEEGAARYTRTQLFGWLS